MGAGYPYGQGAALGYQQLRVTVATTLPVPFGATRVQIAVSDNAVRYRDDGTAPTSDLGYPLSVGEEIIYAGNLSAIQFVSQSSTATLDLLFYR